MNVKVLVVDDSNLARRTVRTLLEESGYTVEEASDGAQALEQYFIHRHDIVILDMLMSGLSGLDVLLKLRQLNPDAQVIVATADIQTSTRDQVRGAGAAAFINKPLNRASLTAVLDQVIKGEFQWN